MHIITPYDPWSPKKNKKTWQEEMWEQQDVAELEARVLSEQSTIHHSTALQHDVNSSMAPAGAGGVPVYTYFHPIGPATYVATIERTAYDFSTTAILPKFNSALGTLQSVQLYTVATGEFYLALENLAETSQSYGIDFVETVVTEVDSTPLSVIIPAAPTYVLTLGSYDGVLDYSGSSGRTYTVRTGTDSNTLDYTDPETITPFIATPGSENIELSVYTATQVNDGSAISTSFVTSSYGTVQYRITYQYI